MKAKKTKQIMHDMDEVFWGEYDKLDGYPGRRYMVVDSRTGETLVDEAVLLEKKRVEV